MNQCQNVRRRHEAFLYEYDVRCKSIERIEKSKTQFDKFNK